MKKVLWTVVLLSAAALGGCSDDPTVIDTNPSVEIKEGYRVSSFDFEERLIDGETLANVCYANLKSGYSGFATYEVHLDRNGEMMRCSMHLSDGTVVEDGEYLLTFSDAGLRPLPGMLRVQVEDDHVILAGQARSRYSMKSGSGTKDDPYLIGSARDFDTFLNELRKDELTNGYDLWFRQTADITLPDQGEQPGRGYWGYSFAGHYDGGGHQLKGLYYRGAGNSDKDTCIGVFPVLLNGSEVSDVTISEVSMNRLYGMSGALAGKTVGYVAVSGITVHGNISAETGSGIGGVIGLQEGGSLQVDGVTLKISVEGADDIGGVIGRVNDGICSISGVQTPDYHFSVSGKNRTGGVAGSVTKGSISVSGAELLHVISEEDKDIHIIENTGGSSTGGIVGRLDNVAQSSFSGIRVACPVGGAGGAGEKIGGLIGETSGCGNITLGSCGVTSMVTGGCDIGGFVGFLDSQSQITVSGDWHHNYVTPDESAAGVEGRENVGGLIGAIEGRFTVTGGNGVRVACNVRASDRNAGGVAGRLAGCDFDFTDINMSSPTMKVEGGANVGGMAGYAENVGLYGSDAFDFPVASGRASIPEADDFKSVFSGVVSGQTCVGGVLGYGKNVSMKAIGAKCTVTGLGGDNIGGIAGEMAAYDRDVRWEDLRAQCIVKANGGNNAGGIIGYVEAGHYAYMTDCINYGEVADGDNIGGIVGYYLDTMKSFSRQCAIVWSVNQGAVTGNNRVGGIMGRYDNKYDKGEVCLNVERCGNNGQVSGIASGSNSSGVGGIAGFATRQAQFRHCANNASIVSEAGHKAVGGIAGSLGYDPSGATGPKANVNVYYCGNTGTIDSRKSETYVGGIVGYMEEGPYSRLEQCLNRGEVLNKHKHDNGGLVGCVDHQCNVYNCVNLGKVNYGNAAIGTHKSSCIFYHGGLYYLEGTGSGWPSATKISKGNIADKSKYKGIDFDNGEWHMRDDGPDLSNCVFLR